MRAGGVELILIRHPAPQVAPGLCYGSADVPADPGALTASHAVISSALLPLMATQPPSPAASPPIYTSPLQRCTALAALLAATPGIGGGAPIVDPRLAELHFGAWELRPWSAIPRNEVDAWAADLLNYRPGGGESVLQAAHRVQAFLQSLSSPAIIVCHAGTIRLLQALATGADLQQAALQAASKAHALDYGSIHRVIIE